MPSPDLKPDEVRLVPMNPRQLDRVREAAAERCIAPGMDPDPDLQALADAFESGLTEQDAIGLLANPPNPPVAAFKLRTAFKEQG